MGSPPIGSLNILRVIARLNIGGPARHVILLDRGLTERGHHTLLVHGVVGEGEASLEPLAHTLGIRTFQIDELGRRISPFADAVALYRLLRLLFKEQPDVVHTHTAKAGTLGRLAALVFNATRGRDHRCAVIHTFHGNVLAGYFGAVGSAAVRLTERTLARATDQIVAISRRQRDELAIDFRVASSSRISIIPLGLDLRRLLELSDGAPTLRSSIGIDDDEVVVGYVGRMVPIKNLGMLLQGFAIAANEESRLRLVLAGDGPLREELERMVRELGIASRVNFLGWVEDLRSLYATLDVCVITSLNEGTPVALIEAMAAGKAVVGTNVGGVSDVIDDNRTGLLIRSGQTQELSEALMRLARDRALRRQLGKAARASVDARYGLTRLIDEVELLYQQRVTAKRKSGFRTTI